MPVNHNTITGNAVLGFRGVCLMHAMECYLRSNGKMQLTRVATPKNMRAIATEFTGKVYPRSLKGLVQAYSDMRALQDGKSLDQLGEVAKVNALVGGVASDLSDGV